MAVKVDVAEQDQPVVGYGFDGGKEPGPDRFFRQGGEHLTFRGLVFRPDGSQKDLRSIRELPGHDVLGRIRRDDQVRIVGSAAGNVVIVKNDPYAQCEWYTIRYGQGIDVNFGYFGEVDDQVGKIDQDLLESFKIRRRFAPKALEHLGHG